MKVKHVVTALVFGVLFGAVGTWLAMRPARVDRYVLTQDLDLERTYFFDPKASAPVKGVIAKGSEFEVDWRHSRADYVVFRTVVDRQALKALSQPAPNDRRESAEPADSTRMTP